MNNYYKNFTFNQAEQNAHWCTNIKFEARSPKLNVVYPTSLAIHFWIH